TSANYQLAMHRCRILNLPPHRALTPFEALHEGSMKADRWFHSCTGVVFLVTVLAGSHWFVMAGRGAAGRVIDRGIFVLELGTASQSLPSLLSGGGGQFFEEASSVIKVEGERYPATPRKADRPLEPDCLRSKRDKVDKAFGSTCEPA